MRASDLVPLSTQPDATAQGSSYMHEQSPQSVAERLSAALKLKEAGNELYKVSSWRKAARKYHEALLYVKAVRDRPPDPLSKLLGGSIVRGPTKEDMKKADMLFVAVTNNLAACMLKMERWSSVVRHASLVLDMEPSNVKALFRRGTAYQHLSKLDEAKTDLQNALKLDPSDAGIKKQLSHVQQLLKIHWDGEKKKYQGLFQS